MWPVCVILEKRIFTKIIYKKCGVETRSTPLCLYKEVNTLLENKISETSWFYWICNSRTIKICQNQHAGFHRFIFYSGFFENNKGTGASFIVTHFEDFSWVKVFLLQYYINWPNFITRLFLLRKLFSKICFLFHA